MKFACTMLVILGLTVPCFATPPAPGISSGSSETQPAQGAQQQGVGETGTSEGILAKLSLSNFPNNGGPVGAPLLGDMWGLRKQLSQYGISFLLSETSEDLGNVTGGVKQGFQYDGVTQMALQLDTQQAGAWYGGDFNVSGLWVHGSNLSEENLGVLQTATGIEAEPSLRLWELWYQQKFFEGDKLDIRIGQQSLDQEFMVSVNGNFFINSMMGWPMLPSADLPGGSSAYPLSALGVRARVHLTNSLTLLAGVFNGSPVSGYPDDPQQANRSGISFPLNGGALMIAELQYSYPSLGTLVDPDHPQALAGTYKLGFWYDTEDFADQEFGTDGLSLANPSSNGIPQIHGGDYSFYAVMDQMIWQSDEAYSRTLNIFAKPMVAPQEDRNLVDFSTVAGVTLHEPFNQRDDDTFGIGAGYAKVSGGAAGLDKDTGSFTGSYYPVRTGEEFVEATYQYQVAPWWQIQPDFQYFFNPGGGVPNPNAPGQNIRNEAVLGIRTTIQF